jgi:hypothetical protein
MRQSFTALAYAAAITAGVVLFTIGPPGRQGASSSVSAAAQPTPAPSTVSVGGVMLQSVRMDLPDSDRSFPGPGADVVNNNCLACHSAGMILTQPRLPRAVWQAEVEKMRNPYKAPVAAENVPAIVDYLAKLPE